MDKYFRHFKGGVYRFIGIAKDSETQEEMVVYQAMYGDRQMWVRPMKTNRSCTCPMKWTSSSSTSPSCGTDSRKV